MDENIVTQINLQEGMIDLGFGNPDLNLLPLDKIQASAELYFSTKDRRSLQYGIEQGDGNFRRALSEFLAKGYQAPVDPASLFITSGASAGLDLLCTLYTQPGDIIFVEEPTYFLALRIFNDHGLQALPIPIDAQGLRIDAVEQMLEDVQPKLLYTVPTFQNPSGLTLSTARRQRLIELAEQRNFMIVADEVYHFLSYETRPPTSFGALAGEHAAIISVNSFSKILAPGLRLGWIQAHPTVVSRLAGSGLLDSGGGMNPFSSALLRGLIETGELAANIRELKAAYSERLASMASALRRYLPTAEYQVPQGGFYFWVRIPGVNAAELRSKARGYQVDLRPGELFSSRSRLREFMRLGFCYYDSAAIEEGIRRLGECLLSYAERDTA